MGVEDPLRELGEELRTEQPHEPHRDDPLRVVGPSTGGEFAVPFGFVGEVARRHDLDGDPSAASPADCAAARLIGNEGDDVGGEVRFERSVHKSLEQGSRS